MKFECLHQLWHWLMDNLADGLVLSHPLRQMNGLSQPRERERWNGRKKSYTNHDQLPLYYMDSHVTDHRTRHHNLAYSDSLLITISYLLLLLR